MTEGALEPTEELSPAGSGQTASDQLACTHA